MEKYSWSFNEEDEIWDNERYDNIEDCIAEAKQMVADEDYQTDEPPTIVYVGENIAFIPSVDVESVLENIQEQAYEYCGEIGGDWNAYDYKQKEELQELEDSMNDVLRTWLKKYSYYPSLWNIQSINGYSLEANNDTEG